MRSTRTTALVMAFGLSLSLAACGSSDPEPAATSATSTESATTAAPAPAETMNASAPFGSACSAVPTTGAGSFDGMMTDPVATAASNNPLLSTLVTAVTAADLGSTLNSSKNITVFAPTNDAFAALDPATLNAAMADPKGLLTKVLTNHVVGEQLSPADLAGTHMTLNGTSITVTGSGENFMVGNAKIICGNVHTANATVYIIDQVLLPAS